MDADEREAHDRKRWQHMVWLDPDDPDGSYDALLEAFPELRRAVQGEDDTDAPTG
jgi:hypothetical protein